MLVVMPRPVTDETSLVIVRRMLVRPVALVSVPSPGS